MKEDNSMASVTSRINVIKQPRGGFIKPSEFESILLEDNNKLNDTEIVHPSIIGMTVDYLTRFMNGADIKDAFQISLLGAKLAGEEDVANKLISKIKGLDDVSIESACQLTTFDVWYRNPIAAPMAKSWRETMLDRETTDNIKIMVTRSLNFFKTYGPVVKDGFTFEPNGYTNIVDTGDGDFLTKDTLWDFKVSKSKPTNKHTLQLLMYWIMGQHSGQDIYKTINKLGIFNPRLNTVYILDINKVNPNTIRIVEKDVIGY